MMIRRFTVLLFLALLTVCSSRSIADDALPPATSLIPQSSFVVAQVRNPKALIDRAFNDRIVNFVKALPPYEAAKANPGLQAAHFFASTNDLNMQQMITQLVGGGITLGVGYDEAALVIVDAEDAELLKKAHDFVMLMVKGDNPDKVKSSEYRGVTGWSFGPGDSHAIIGKRLIWSNKPAALKAALDCHADSGSASMAQSAVYQKALATVDGDAKATFFADIDVLKQVPGFQKALTQNQHPVVRLLFAPLLGTLGDATWLAGGVNIDDSDVSIEVAADGVVVDASDPDSFAWPQEPGAGAMPYLAVPRQIAVLSFYRDLHKFYAAKDELFPERTSGLIFFENMMGIFFSGRDLTEEVLGETLPDIRFVVAEQEFKDKSQTPSIQFPGFAAVIQISNPDEFSLVMRAAWQNAIGLVNTTSGQKAQPTLVIETDVHAGTKYTTSRFLFPGGNENSAGDNRLNTQPTIATHGDHLIMSSTEALAKDLIDALTKESEAGAKPVAGKHSLAKLNVAPLASILNANRAAMIRQNMVEKGHSREDAENEINGIMTVMKFFRQLEIGAGAEDGVAKMSIKLGYELP